MTTRTWPGKVLERYSSVHAPRSNGRRPKARRPLRVEALEDRTVPSDSHLTLELRPPAGATSPAPVTIYPDAFAFGFHNPTTIGSATGGAGAGKVKFDELQVTAPMSPDSPVLLKALAAGLHYDTAVLTQRDSDGDPVAAWVLKTVSLSDDAIDNDSAAIPRERLSFAFGSVTEATSDTIQSWNQVTNTASGPALPAGLVLEPLPAPPAQPAVTLELTGSGTVPSVTIPLNDYSFGFSNTGSIGSATGGAGAGKAKFDQLAVTAPFGADSPLLLRSLAAGFHYDTAVLTQRDSAGDPVAAWVLGTVFLSDDVITGGDELPTEDLTFVFGSITEATSARTTSWDQVTNTAAGPALPAGLVLEPLPAGPAAPAITLDLNPALVSEPAVSIPLTDYSFGFSNTGSIGSATGGAGAGKATFDELAVKAPYGADSPLLLRALTAGAHYSTAVLTQRDSAGNPVAAWVLGTVFLSDDAIAGGDGLPTEALSFVFGSITEATASASASWSQITNTASGPSLPAGLVLSPLPAGPTDPSITLDLISASGLVPAVSVAVSEFAFGFENPTTIGSATGGAGAGKAKFNEFQIKKSLDAASPSFFRSVVAGLHYSTAVLTQRDSAGDPVAAWVLGTVFLSDDAIDGGDGLPTEALSFFFGSITEATSARTTSWDQVTNTADGPALPAGLVLEPFPAGPAAPAITLDLTPPLGSLPAVSIPVNQFAFGFSNLTTIGSATGGAGAGKARFDELSITAPFGADSPALLRALVTGSHYNTAVLTQRDSDGDPVAAWVLGTVFMTDNAVFGGDNLPTEALSFVFGAITEATSARTTSWNQVTNMAGGPALPAGLVLDPLPAGPATPAITLDLTATGGLLPPISLPLDGYAFGFHNATTIGSATGGAGAGKATFDELSVIAPFGADSPALLRALVTGSHYNTAVLTQRNSAGRPVAAWVLDTVFLSDDGISGGAGLPPETLSFVFGAITEATSARTTSWDQVTNTADGPPLPSGLVLVPIDDRPPTDITLSNAAVAENEPVGAPVGLFSTIDPDVGDVFDYALVSGPGATDNGAFLLDPAGNLTTAASFDFEARTSYSIRVRSTDVAGFFVERVFTVAVTNVNEAPTVTGFSKVGAEDNTLSFTAGDFTGHYSDPEGDPLAGVRIESLPTGGVLRLAGTAVTAGQVIAAADLNALVFVPALNFSGVVSFQYTGTDGALFSLSPATITLDIRSIAQQVETLEQIIQSLVAAGTLTSGQGEALRIDLRGNNGDAGRVRAFLNQLDAFLQAGILSPEQYAGLNQLGRALLASILNR